MRKKILVFILIFMGTSVLAQDDLLWKTVLNEQFNNNYNGWHTESSDIRYAQITNGKLLDRFSLKGYSQSNQLSINLNSNKDHLISFSLTNLHGDADKKYRVYQKKNDGTLKEAWENNPTWGFVWGFKDWNNYNCIIFYNSREYNQFAIGNYLYYTWVKIYYTENGETKTVLNWNQYKLPYVGMNPILVSIFRSNTNTSILIGDKLIENSNGHYKWYGNKIGPFIGSGANVSFDDVVILEKLPHPTTTWNEFSLKSHWTSKGADLIEGIYENVAKTQNSPKYKLGLIKTYSGYELIYLGGAEEPGWKVGDIKAYLTKTATPNLFKVKYFMGNKSLNEDLYIGFESGFMKIMWPDRQENLYIKLYPASEDNVSTYTGIKSSGTGFAISSNGYIVTNHHVIDGASKISIRGVKSNFAKVYNAKLIVEDKKNDLAIIKIDDESFTSLGTPPYTINSSICDVGNTVYALGFPLRSTMGDEVKLTNGIISSKSGFQGDITAYQISVPIQPGNSGGPLFDSNGNIVGIVNAKHTGAENVSYAIKTSYLMNLIQVMNTPPNLPKLNTISSKNLSEQVKFLKEFVYIIEIR